MASHGEPHNRKDALDPISQSEWEKDPFNLNSCLKLQDIRLEGVGSRARVFSVTHHHHDSPGDVLKNAKPRVCLKIITASFGDTAEHNLEVLRKNVLGVIKVWRNLEHPNINPIYGWTLDPTSNDSHFCFVSQFCPNYNVSRYLRKHPDADREKIVCEVAKGLRYLHDEANIVHGDVKPNNVLISDEGIAMLSDFGQAEILDRAPQNLQDAGRFLTIEYWPPEVFSTEDADYPLQRSKSGDVWAFGCTLLEVSYPEFFLQKMANPVL
ncbi:kinase-like domain-containing protein [Cantharellus anzutake]|uniref:kinase-like domain-containing protein n=1 Tax=Cantharellus anzutake TaxID=1750568 RepID=UPI001904B453|nr:kinase-like domain-containing protein [Cantharellus anzutake]KAF8329581.1 kinase-like domain-containing protein [Cantharellus anzutake]